MKVLSAERDIFGAERYSLGLAAVTQDILNLAWSGEDTLLVVYRAGDRDVLRAVSVAEPAKQLWEVQLTSPSSTDHDFTFMHESSRSPILLAWVYDEPRPRVDWAARIDVANRKIIPLDAKGLSALRKEAVILLPASNPEEEGPKVRLSHYDHVTIMTGSGRVLVRIQLDKEKGYEGGLVLPAPDYYGRDLPGNRYVAEEHRPKLVLFSVLPSKLVVYPLTRNYYPVAEVPTGEAQFFGQVFPGQPTAHTWSDYPEVMEACISVDGSAVAFVRDESASRILSRSEPSRPSQADILDEEHMHCSELRLVSAVHPLALVDFMAGIGRRVKNEWTEPPGLPLQAAISIGLPSLSPHGSRIAYIKNGDVWIANLPRPG
jgi:hypothetical protein